MGTFWVTLESRGFREAVRALLLVTYLSDASVDHSGSGSGGRRFESCRPDQLTQWFTESGGQQKRRLGGNGWGAERGGYSGGLYESV